MGIQEFVNKKLLRVAAINAAAQAITAAVCGVALWRVLPVWCPARIRAPDWKHEVRNQSHSGQGGRASHRVTYFPPGSAPVRGSLRLHGST